MELIPAVSDTKTTVFWDVTTCSLEDNSLRNVDGDLTTRCHDASAGNLQSNFPGYLKTQSDVPLQSCDFDQSESLLFKYYIFLPAARITLNLKQSNTDNVRTM